MGFRGQNRGKVVWYWPSTNSLLLFGASYICDNFGKNRSRNATMRVLTYRETDWQMQTNFIIYAMLYAIAMGQIKIQSEKKLLSRAIGWCWSRLPADHRYGGIVSRCACSSPPPQLSLLLILPNPEGWPGWVNLGGWWYERGSNPWTVADPSTNQQYWPDIKQLCWSQPMHCHYTSDNYTYSDNHMQPHNLSTKFYKNLTMQILTAKYTEPHSAMMSSDFGLFLLYSEYM